MTARHPLQKNRQPYRQAKKMGSGTPKAAGSTTPFRSTEHSFRPLPPSNVALECTSGSLDVAGSSCYRNVKVHDGTAHRDQHCGDAGKSGTEGGSLQEKTTMAPCSFFTIEDIPEQLADLLANMIPGGEGEELGRAFRLAAELPPITKQSLSELDIQNIITNIKLRHDINFDRDLSFRPNLDGSKGQEKMKVAAKYWKALAAELELYVRIFQGAPPLFNSEQENLKEIVEGAKRRIPKMFETIRDVLKSLVPERDYSRVDEHLDMPMLMQGIERGVCDLVRLAEWLAQLLKEHCAPMRDHLVDQMVESTKAGVAGNSSATIIEGLRKLLGVLEAMKLDIANHQIRNLKTVLIEDTVNFERHYHLDRLVRGRTRVSVETTHRWYESAQARFLHSCMPSQKNTSRVHLEVFVRAVTSALFMPAAQWDLPETFYLDQDRLRAVKSEIDDLLHFEICFDVFVQLLQELGYRSPIPLTARHTLRTSISAVIGQSLGHNSSQWPLNTENIAMEIIRQAVLLSGSSQNYIYTFDVCQRISRRLSDLYTHRFATHAPTLETHLLHQVLASVNKHIHSSPVELFNSLTVMPKPPPVFPQASVLTPNSFLDHSNTLSPAPDMFSELANRITHIVLLHWRIWGPIAYVLEEGSSAPLPTGPPFASPSSYLGAAPSPFSTTPITSSPSPLPSPLLPTTHALPPPPPPAIEDSPSETSSVGSILKTGDPPDPPGQGALG